MFVPATGAVVSIAVPLGSLDPVATPVGVIEVGGADGGAEDVEAVVEACRRRRGVLEGGAGGVPGSSSLPVHKACGCMASAGVMGFTRMVILSQARTSG